MISLLTFLTFTLSGLLPANMHFDSVASATIDHVIWDELTGDHVNKDGTVDYRGFISEKDKLEKYLSLLSTNAPDKEGWSTEAQLAYWINAYNAFTVKLIVDNYPLESIKDIKKGIPMVNSVWDIKFIEIGGESLDLNKIEHGILRKEFNEPRIHFAINCASVSCPSLRNEAYTAERLEKQLDEQTRMFLSDQSKNRLTSSHVEISKIFQWFGGDFTKDGTIIDFLNRYSDTRINADARISYLEYDWNLNE